jgi:hypothetical protein
MKARKARLFLKKKAPRLGKQKNVCSPGGVATPGPAAPFSKSFLLRQAASHFFKKEALSSC